MIKRLLLFIVFVNILFVYTIYGQNYIDITKINNGQTITLSTNKILEIKLPRGSSNGYIWYESITLTDKSNQKSIKQIADGNFIHDNFSGTSVKGKIVGQSGLQVLRYINSSEGVTKLTLELRRPWEMDNSAIDNFSITVISVGKYTGNYMPPLNRKIEHSTLTPKVAPIRWDWRSQCTPIANQQECGDCWAFAGVGTFECNIKIIDGVTRDISEEYLTDCYTADNCNGCGGGFCPHAAWLPSFTNGDGYNYQGGAVYESEDPWTSSESSGYTGTCGGPYTYHETIESFADIAGEDSMGIPPDASMKAAIYNYGPIWVGIDASSSSWPNYTGGILTEASQTGEIDHAVVLVGWVDSAAVSGGGYWILRNAWGAGWGIHGYMYISYGSDLVGTLADYIVYKGGTPHTVPPFANFGSQETTNCTGEIQFADSSYNSPESWRWDFGDNTTSTLENPSHTYYNSGTFNVKLVVKNKYGSDSLTRKSYITINLSETPTTTGASCTGPCKVTLSASGSGTLNWYDAPTGGNLINTGSTYTTPVLKDSTTYYVQSEVVQPVKTAGMAAYTQNGSYYYGTNYDGYWGLIFDVYKPLTILSVTVYANSTDTRTIWLENSSGTLINSLVTNISSGKQVVTLNFEVPAGTGYVLGTNGENDLWRESSGASYPYTTSGLLSITGNNAEAMDHYYYFYNWKVQPQPCVSSRVPVVAAINTLTDINDISATSCFGIFPNPSTGIFEIKLNSQNYQNVTISLINVLGQTLLQKKVNYTNVPIEIDASGFQDGVYFLMLQTNEATYSKKIIIYRK